jgi:integrase
MHGTLAAEAEYRRVLVEWQANDRRRKQATGGASVAELLLAYWQHAQKYYRHPDGRPTTEIANLKPPLRRLRELYADKPAADLDSLALVAVRDGMIQDGLTRKSINKDIDRIKRVFKWAAAQKLVPITTYQQLTTLDGLRRGRSAARESAPVKPVPDCWVNETLPYLHPTVRAMAELQRATGMRPTEVCILRGCDIDMTGKIWTYRPSDHKNSYREHERIVAIGPRGQAALRPHLKLNLQAYVFDPREEVEAWIAVKGQRRPGRGAHYRRGMPGRPQDHLHLLPGADRQGTDGLMCRLVAVGEGTTGKRWPTICGRSRARHAGLRAVRRRRRCASARFQEATDDPQQSWSPIRRASRDIRMS